MFEPKLSIVIPFYNEEARLASTLPNILSFIKEQPYTCELIFVNDGSTDNSANMIRNHLQATPHQLLEHHPNEGKGSAVKKGMLAATGKFVLFSDADLSTPLDEVNRFIPYLEMQFDIVIASRGLKNSKVEIHQNFIRETMGKCFNGLARIMSFRNIQDSQCGFKCFRRGAAHKLFSKQKIKGFAFDAEILYLAQMANFQIKEEPVIWRNNPQTKVRLLLDPLKMLMDIARIRWMHRKTRI